MSLIEELLAEFQAKGPTASTLDVLAPLVKDSRVTKIMLDVLADRRWKNLWDTAIIAFRDKVSSDPEQREQLRRVLLRILAEEEDSLLRQLTALSLKFFASRKDVEDVLVALLKDPREACGVRVAALYTLAETGSWQQREPLVRAMLSEQKTDIAQTAERILARRSTASTD